MLASDTHVESIHGTGESWGAWVARLALESVLPRKPNIVPTAAITHSQ